MECVSCHAVKLSNEFSTEPLSRKCQHINKHCLVCSLEALIAPKASFASAVSSPVLQTNYTIPVDDEYALGDDDDLAEDGIVAHTQQHQYDDEEVEEEYCSDEQNDEEEEAPSPYKCFICNSTVSKAKFAELQQQLNAVQISGLLSTLHGDGAEEQVQQQQQVSMNANIKINCACITGEAFTVDAKFSDTIAMLKEKIAAKIPIVGANKKVTGKQLILFHNNEQLALDGHEIQTVASCNITSTNNHIQYAISLLELNPHSKIKEIDFRMQWSNTSDHLDGNCFTYNHKGDYVEKISYEWIWSQPGLTGQDAIVHGGDTRGRQSIKIDLRKVEKHVKHLVFTLSAYNAPSISHFENPGFQMYDVSNPNQSLCSYAVKNVNEKAIILCSLTRDKYGTWNVIQIGKESKGNMHSEWELSKTIEACIATL